MSDFIKITGIIEDDNSDYSYYTFVKTSFISQVSTVRINRNGAKVEATDIKARDSYILTLESIDSVMNRIELND